MVYRPRPTAANRSRFVRKDRAPGDDFRMDNRGANRSGEVQRGDLRNSSTRTTALGWPPKSLGRKLAQDIRHWLSDRSGRFSHRDELPLARRAGRARVRRKKSLCGTTARIVILAMRSDENLCAREGRLLAQAL